MAVWVDVLENPKAINSLFRSTEGFSLIDLQEVGLISNGPGLRLRVDVDVVPTPLPSKWTLGSNTTQFVVTAWGISGLEIRGWSTSVAGQFTASPSDDRMHLHFHSKKCEITASALSLRVESMTGYINNKTV
jgi:hypothetical protein